MQGILPALSIMVTSGHLLISFPLMIPLYISSDLHSVVNVITGIGKNL